jgi:hypothetical protein
MVQGDRAAHPSGAHRWPFSPVLLLLLLPAWLVSCRPASDDAAVVATPVARPAAQTPVSIGGLTQAPAVSLSPPAADELVRRAIADAAAHASVPSQQVVAVSVTPREWPDRSLGCPKPGMGYAQSVTPGFLIILDVGGQQIAYHTDNRQVIRCGA